MSARTRANSRKLYAVFLAQECHRTDWRWAVAHRMVAAGIPAAAAVDVTVRRLVKYLQARTYSPESAAAADPELSAVIAIQGNAARTPTLKLLVVSDSPPAEICRQSNLDPQALQLWEDTFFDVRGRLEARDWVAIYVVDAEAKSGNPRLADELRIAASRGPAMARLLLRIQSKEAIEEEEKLLHLRTRFEVKLEEALRFPLTTSPQAMRLIEASVTLEDLAKEYNLAKEQLANRERQEQRTHEETMVRLQAKHIEKLIHARVLGVEVNSFVSDPMARQVDQALRAAITVDSVAPAAGWTAAAQSQVTMAQPSIPTGTVEDADDELIVLMFPQRAKSTTDDNFVLAPAWPDSSTAARHPPVEQSHPSDTSARSKSA